MRIKIHLHPDSHVLYNCENSNNETADIAPKQSVDTGPWYETI